MSQKARRCRGPCLITGCPSGFGRHRATAELGKADRIPATAHDDLIDEQLGEIDGYRRHEPLWSTFTHHSHR
jgi:hypothetical protein